jgi:hypothetical protein
MDCLWDSLARFTRASDAQKTEFVVGWAQEKLVVIRLSCPVVDEIVARAGLRVIVLLALAMRISVLRRSPWGGIRSDFVDESGQISVETQG